MATKEQLREMVRAEPFRRFHVRMTGGRTFEVRHPENISCDWKGRNLVIHDKDGMHFVEMLLVEVMEPVEPPPPEPGPDKPRKRKGGGA
jgi:hypothetical protein